jgi:glycosyl transferase, family 25
MNTSVVSPIRDGFSAHETIGTMRLTEYFQQLYIINLRERADRRREMAEQLHGIGLTFESPGVSLFEATRPSSAEAFPSLGAHGAFQSHLRVLRDARARNFQRILVLEDDLNFVPEFPERIPAVLDALQKKNWSIFYGGYFLPSSPNPELAEAANPDLLLEAEPTVQIQTAHFIGFQGESIASALKYLEGILGRPAGDPRGGPMHVDGAYSWFRNTYPHMLTVLACPHLGYQRSSRSDIAETRWHDRVPGVRRAASIMRKLKNRVR